MSYGDYQHHPKDMIPYAKNNPSCPKCGGLTKRYFEIGSQGYSSHYRSFQWEDKEFLNVHCQACHYEFPQKTKDYKPSKKKE